MCAGSTRAKIRPLDDLVVAESARDLGPRSPLPPSPISAPIAAAVPRVVSGDHHHPDAGIARRVQCRTAAARGWVGQAGQPVEDEVRSRCVLAADGIVSLPGQRQHPERLCRRAARWRPGRGTALTAGRAHPIGVRMPVAALKNDLGSALGEDECDVGRARPPRSSACGLTRRAAPRSAPRAQSRLPPSSLPRGALCRSGRPGSRRLHRDARRCRVPRRARPDGHAHRPRHQRSRTRRSARRRAR